MGKNRILQPEENYSFPSYFELPYEADEILAEFDYQLLKEELKLPKSEVKLTGIEALKSEIKTILPYISLSNETARRETLVAPILLKIVAFCHCQLRIEYPVKINNLLSGKLDYLLRAKNNNLLIIEAKNDDLTRVFTQLAIELIALAELESQNIIYGAVTMGDIWRFGKLNTEKKVIIQDINLFKIPTELEELALTLVGILERIETEA